MKWLSLLLVTTLLLCSMPVVAFASGEDSTAKNAPKEISFSSDRLLTVHEPLTEAPNSFHAVISVPKGTTKGGVLFGNYLSLSYGFFSLEVNEKGNPVLRFTNDKNEIVTATFNAVDLRQGAKVTLTVVRTDVMAYCYINGVLAQTLEGAFAYGDVMTAEDVWAKIGSNYHDPNGQEFILGGDNTKNNPNYFKGTMSSLSLYTEALSASGVENVILGTCSYSPLLSYIIGEGDSISCVTDRSGNGYNASTTFYERPYELGEYEFSFAVVGDTQVQVQVDVEDGSNYTANIYDYLVANKTSKKIGYVFGVGDITQTNVVPEWDLAKEQVTKLDKAGIGYSLVPGDHDNNSDYYTEHVNYNNAFLNTLSPRIAGFYDEAAGLTNYYMTFEVGTQKFAVLCLEVGPRTAVMQWAGEVIQSHPDRKFIITTHSYLAKNGTTTDPGDAGAKNDSGSMGANSPSNGDRMWDELVSLYENVFMVFSGHIAYENVVMRQDRGVNGNTVTQFLVNHQSLPASYSMVYMLYFTKDGDVRGEWISTTKSLEAGEDIFYKTQSTMTFNAYEFDGEGTLIGESRFDGGTNDITTNKSGTGTMMSTNNGIFKFFYDPNNLPTSSSQYTTFSKKVYFNESYAYKYLTVEFDLATESQFFSQIELYSVPRNSSGGRNNLRNKIIKKNGVLYITDADQTELYPLGISHANEWTHITMVYDTENMIGGKGDTFDIPVHIFVNGEYALTNEHPFHSGATYFNEVRLSVSKTFANATGSICVDNIVFKGFQPAEAEGIDQVLAEKWLNLSSVSGIEYKSDYTFPNGTPLARVTSGGIDTLYYNEFDLGASVKAGDTVTMLRDAYTPVSFANAVTVVNENNYKLIYDTAKDFSITTADGTTFCNADGFIAAVKATANKPAIIEQYNDITFTSSQVFNIQEKGLSLPNVWNMNGHSVTASAQGDHFFKFSSSDYVANWIINNGSFSTNSKNTVFLCNSADYMEFNNVSFLGYSTMEIRDGKIRLNGCTIRTNAGAFCTVSAARVDKGAYIHYRNCDITLTLTSPSGLIIKHYKESGNDYVINFEYCNIKRYTVNASKALITTDGTADAALTEFAPVINFIGSKVYSRILAFHNFGHLTINVTEGSQLDVDHTSIDACAKWVGSIYLGNAIEAKADRYKLTLNIEDGTHLSNRTLVDNTAGKMNAENLTVTMGATNSYAKKIGDPNCPYIVGAPDFTVKSSLTLYSDFDYNLFLPVDTGVDTLTVNGKVLTPVGVYAVGDEYYHRYTFRGIYVNESAEDFQASITSEDYNLSLTLNILSYAEKVLADQNNADAHQLMLDMLAYIKEAYLYSSKNTDAIEALIATYGTPSTYAPRESETALPKAVTEYINGVSVSLGNSPAFKFRVAKDATILLSYIDADGNKQTKRYQSTAGDILRLDMHMFDFTSEITVEIEGTDARGTFDLYTYITTIQTDENAENDTCLPLAKALYTYSQSALCYKENLQK